MLLAASALLAGAPVLAQRPNRTAAFAGLDGAAAAALATAIGMETVAPDPAPPGLAVSLAPGAVFVVQPVGLACTGQRVAVDPAPLFARLAPEPVMPAVRLAVTSGRGFRRCVNAAEFRERCLTTVELAATLETADGRSLPVRAAVTRDHGAGATCRNIPEGTALATREAAIALLAAATALGAVATPEPAR